MIVDSLLSKIPGPFSMEQVETKFPSRFDESLNDVLHQEVVSFNRLVTIIRGSLEELQKSLKGLTVMSTELDDLADSLAILKVPALWMTRSYPNVKPLGAYVADLVHRLQFFKQWIDQGAPKVFWISG